MRTTSIEVKTIYEIRFNINDFQFIFENAKKDPVRLHAFDNFCLEDDTPENIRECFESLGKLSLFLSVEESKQQAENLKYIVNKLGFDGVVNYGGFYGQDKDSKKEYHMTVYNHGADI